MKSLSLYKYCPAQFFVITFLGTWIPWFSAAYLSYQKGMEGFQLLFFIIGGFAPFIVVLLMIYSSRNKSFINDFWDRLRFKRIKFHFILVPLLLIPCVLFLATSLSLLFNQSTNQFALSDEYKIIEGQNVLSIAIIFLAPLIEELGWRGYGVDSIRCYFNLFKTTLLFACIWAIWHLPLFFIKGYYQHELWNENFVYVINFFISILPATILLNWVYYKNNRSISMAILMHFSFNLFSVLFNTEQFTKCLVTILLLIISIFVLLRNKQFFCER